MDDCVVCLEQCDNIWGSAIIDSSIVCHNCVRGIFERAIQSEEDYPPKWGSKKLNIQDYLFSIPRDLLQQFKEKEREYETPPAERIYCTFVDPNLMLDVGEVGTPCGCFVGRIAEDWAKRFRAGAICPIRCTPCGTFYCIICGEQSQFAHRCIKPGPSKEDDSAFAGLEKGKDYQICPSSTCRRKIELRDGCNSIACKCGERFCFVCGEGGIKSNHWKKTKNEGGCPRFGHPSASNALWLDEPDLDDFDAHFQRVQRMLARVERRNAVVGFPNAEEGDQDLLGDLVNGRVPLNDNQRRGREIRPRREQARGVGAPAVQQNPAPVRPFIRDGFLFDRGQERWHDEFLAREAARNHGQREQLRELDVRPLQPDPAPARPFIRDGFLFDRGQERWHDEFLAREAARNQGQHDAASAHRNAATDMNHPEVGPFGDFRHPFQLQATPPTRFGQPVQTRGDASRNAMPGLPPHVQHVQPPFAPPLRTPQDAGRTLTQPQSVFNIAGFVSANPIEQGQRQPEVASQAGNNSRFRQTGGQFRP